MSDFIAVSPTDNQEDQEVTNIPFFPNIKIKAVREEQRLDGTVTTVRLRRTIINAIVRVNDDLVMWRQEQESKGISSLNDVSNELIDGESKYIHYYKNAVFNLVSALILDRFLNFDATAKAVNKADTEVISAGDYYRDSRYAIRDILGISHSTAELI